MYKASQQALAQETNLQLVSIRQSEIDYYVAVMTTLGTQAALIGGFTYGLFTLTEESEEEWAGACAAAYHVFSGVCIAASVHVIIVTLLLTILGPGLALNGPVGSMAKAAEAMRSELDEVVLAFFIMIFGFTASTIMSFWTVMNLTASIICTAVFVVAARAWWFYSRRIYLRLYWDKTQLNFHESNDGEVNPLSKFNNSTLSLGDTSTGTQKLSISASGVLMEGYGGMRAVKSVNDALKTNQSFDRRYLILNNKGELIAYKSRETFRKDPKKPLNERPLEVEDFKITVANPEKAEQYDVLFVAKEDEENGRKFVFHFDDQEELQLWNEAFALFNRN